MIQQPTEALRDIDAVDRLADLKGTIAPVRRISADLARCRWSWQQFSFSVSKLVECVESGEPILGKYTAGEMLTIAVLDGDLGGTQLSGRTLFEALATRWGQNDTLEDAPRLEWLTRDDGTLVCTAFWHRLAEPTAQQAPGRDETPRRGS